MPEKWAMGDKQLDEAAIFNSARRIDAPEPRARYLKQVCGEHPALLERVDALLRAHDEQKSFLESPPSVFGATADTSAVGEGPGAVIGRYKLLQEIGHGGFGVVYMAEQEQPVRRKVALKIIKLGMDTKQVIARFEAERQALAMMDHPNIAKVLDAGATDSQAPMGVGRPYFVMELVRGVSLTEYCDTERLDTQQRLELFIQVCNAVQHAHTKGIIHRDIKPSNVMITLHDGKPVPKVIDFGIAKATNARLTERTLFTEYGQMIGTPAYMSPEQAEMSGLDIDTRSDIYSLGVLLYELLTGLTPFDARRLKAAGYDELRRIIREEEPPKPSTRLSSLQSGWHGQAQLAREDGGQLPRHGQTSLPMAPRAKQDPSSASFQPLPQDPGSDQGSSAFDIARFRRTDPATLSRSLRGDLDWIVMKCLEKDRQGRYETANGLAADIRRHLSDEPVVASPPSASYRFRKFARRNKRLLGSATGIAAALVIGLTLATYGFITASNERDEKVAALDQEQQARAAEAEQRALAEASARRAADEATRAGKAEADAEQRAVELEQVAEFQSTQLSEIDVELMGTRLRRAILEQRRALLASQVTDQGAIESGLNELEQSLAGVNFTDIALGALDENVFERALDAIEKDFADQPLVKARLYQTVAITLYDLGLLDRAAQPQQEALRIRRETLGDDHPDTLTSINNMGVLLNHQGRLAEAEPYCREALEGRGRVLGDEHPDTLASIQNIGALLQAQGKLAEAEAFYHEALEKRRRVLGDEHPDTLSSIGDLGHLLEAQGKLAEAKPYFHEALGGLRRVLGDDHRDTLGSINNMGRLLYRLGRLAEADPYWREALEGFRHVLGDEHPETLTAIGNIGALLQAQGKLPEAEPYFREALGGLRRVLGDDHPHTLVLIDNMGGILSQQGKLAEAEPLYHEALEGTRRVLGDDHPDTLISINNMGGILNRQGKLAEAEAFYHEALEGKRRVLGDDHPQTLGSIGNMGAVLKAQGKLAEAEPYHREALEGYRRVLGDDHPHTLISINNMGALLKAQGKLGEAEPYLREALEGYRRVLGDDHPHTLISMSNMGYLLQAQGKLAEAEPYFRDALEGFRRLLGDDHPNTLKLIGSTGGMLQAQGKLAEAEPYFRDALEGYRRVLGNEHPDTLASIQEMGALLQAQGKLAEAETYSREALEGRRKLLPAQHGDIAGSLALLGSVLIELGQYVEAEALLRECRGIRQETLAPDPWLTFNTISLLGGALVGQGADPALTVAARIDKLREAEPLLLEAYDGLRASEEEVPAVYWEARLREREALERIVQLYYAWHAAEPNVGHDARAASWRAELEQRLAESKAALEQGAEDD